MYLKNIIKKQVRKALIPFLILLVGLSSCVNLKPVTDLSTASLEALNQFDEIPYSFKKECQDVCEAVKVSNLNLNADTCDCNNGRKIDAANFKIYDVVTSYFKGLATLSDNKMIDYKTDKLSEALKGGDFGKIKIDQAHVDAASKISTIILKAAADGYRKKKIKAYVEQADEPINKLLSLLKINMSNLDILLQNQKQDLKDYYFKLSKEVSMTDLSKKEALKEYYRKRTEIEKKQKEIMVYSKSLAKIAEGHKKLHDGLGKMSKKEIKELLTGYSNDIQEIVSEFKKIKKD